MKSIQAHARVHVTLEVSLSQPWGDDCAIGQLYRSAGSEALQKVREGIKMLTHVKIHGEPKIIGIITEDSE